MKLIELFSEDLDEENVFAISLVGNPAMESEFMLFEKTEFQLSKIDTKKRTITGLALEPDKKVKRFINGEVVEVFFSKDTVKQMAQNYLKKFYQFNTTLEHKDRITDTYVIESWIVNDPNNDKSKSLGFTDVKKGSWFLSLYVDNDDVLNKIENKEISGFSIEAYLSQNIVKFSEEKIIEEKMAEEKKEEKVIEKVIEKDESSNLIDRIKNLFTEKEQLEKEVEKKVDEEVKKVDEEVKKVDEEVKKVDEEVKKVEKEPISPEMLEIVKQLEELKKTNDEMKEQLNKKPDVEPKFNNDKDIIAQTFSQRMGQRLDNHRKKIGNR